MAGIPNSILYTYCIFQLLFNIVVSAKASLLRVNKVNRADGSIVVELDVVFKDLIGFQLNFL